MIELIATAESVAQAKELVDCGVDILYIGEDEYGLRLPYSFTREEQREIIAYAHEKGAQVSAAVNAIFHNDRINQVAEYLAFLREAEVDSITLAIRASCRSCGNRICSSLTVMTHKSW